MPPKKLSESEIFKLAALEGKSAALLDRTDRETAAPENEAVRRKREEKDVFAGGYQTPASGTIGSQQTVFRKPILTFSDRQDLLESRIDETNLAVQEIRGMMSSLYGAFHDTAVSHKIDQRN